MQNKTYGIEKIVLHGCEEFNDDTYEKFQFVRALRKHYVGISAKGAFYSEISCVKKMVKEHLGGDEFFDEVPECENSKIDMTEYGSRKGIDHRNVTSMIMYVSTGLLMLMFVAGGVWDLMKTRNLPRKKEGKRKVCFKGFIHYFQFLFKITNFLVSGKQFKGIREVFAGLIVESEIREIFACGIRNPRVWNPKYSSRKLECYLKL